MNFISAATLIDFYFNVDIFLVIMVRIVAFLIVLPIFSGQNIPVMLKILIAVALSAIVMSSGIVEGVTYDDSIFGYFLLILSEFITGFIIGFVVYFMFSLFYFVGQLVDYQLGYSMVSVFDPVSQIQVPITGNLFYLTVMTFLIISGGMNFFFLTLFDSYKVIPLGYSNVIANSNLIAYIIDIMINYISLGVQIALPVIGTIIIIDVALGMLVKAVPQMNVFVVGMPIKVIIGLIIVYLIFPTIWEAFNIVGSQTTRYVKTIIGLMSQ